MLVCPYCGKPNEIPVDAAFDSILNAWRLLSRGWHVSPRTPGKADVFFDEPQQVGLRNSGERSEDGRRHQRRAATAS